MRAWLKGTEGAQLSEKLSEFARTLAAGGDLSEHLGAACQAVQELLAADRVSFWTLQGQGTCLRWWGGTGCEWAGAELDLSVYVRLAELVRLGAPVWVDMADEVWPATPPPLLGTRSFVVLLLSWRGQIHGCGLAAYDYRGSPPPGEELEASQAVSSLLAGLRQTAEVEKELEQQHQKWNTLLRVGQVLARRAGEKPALEKLLERARDVLAAESLSIYHAQAEAWQRAVAVGNRALFPAGLPRGRDEPFPWDTALETQAPVSLPIAPALASLPELYEAWQTSSRHLWVAPVSAIATRGEVLLVALPAAPTPSDLLAVELLAGVVGLASEAAELPQAMAQAETRYQLFWDALPTPVFRLDARACTSAANRALLEWTGYAAADLLGQPFDRLLADTAAQAAFHTWWASGERCWRWETRWPTRSGLRSCQVLLRRNVNAEAATPDVLGFVSDRSAAQHLEQERQWIEARLKGILDSVHDGVWLIGTDGVVQFANHRLAHLLGADLREVHAGVAHGAVVEQLKRQFRDGEKVAARWHYLNAHMEEVCWDELELAHPRRRVLERFVRPVYDQEEHLVGRLEIYRDITSQRLLERKILQREKLAALGQLLSGIAHELNNSLTAVGGYAQLLRRHALPDPAQQQVERLAQEAERAGRIVKNLLLFARPAKPERQRLDVNDILERALSFRAYELNVENIALVRHYAPDLPPVYGDSHQLQQVFINLLLNAEQAIRNVRDRGTITLRTHSLTAPPRVRVEISDDGSGIPAEELVHIFEPFFTTKGPSEGTGLGLAVSRAIIKEHEGEIYAESPPGSGATFIVELPAQEVEEKPAEVGPTVGHEAARDRQPPHILVVDDEDSVAQLIADVLDQQGYGVEVCTNSRQALAQALAKKFDLLVCDIKMPDLDGEAFHRVLVERDHPLAGRILFTPGDTLARRTADFLERVGLPYLAKPFLVDELKAVVRNLLVEHLPLGNARHG